LPERVTEEKGKGWGARQKKASSIAEKQTRPIGLERRGRSIKKEYCNSAEFGKGTSLTLIRVVANTMKKLSDEPMTRRKEKRHSSLSRKGTPSNAIREEEADNRCRREVGS